MNLATRIYKQYGQESIKVIRENPYQLAQDVFGIGFRTADEIAVKLGLPRDSVERLATGLKYVLAQAANDDGHCFLLENELIRRATDILQAPRELLSQAMERLHSERDVFIEPPLPLQVNLRPQSTGEDEAASEVEARYIDPEEEAEPQQRIYFGPFWHAENGSARIVRALLRSRTNLPPLIHQQWAAVLHDLSQSRNM